VKLGSMVFKAELPKMKARLATVIGMLTLDLVYDLVYFSPCSRFSHLLFVVWAFSVLGSPCFLGYTFGSNRSSFGPLGFRVKERGSFI